MEAVNNKTTLRNEVSDNTFLKKRERVTLVGGPPQKRARVIGAATGRWKAGETGGRTREKARKMVSDSLGDNAQLWRILAASSEGAKIPFSVMMPVINLAGVTSKAGFTTSTPSGAIAALPRRCVTSRWSPCPIRNQS